MTIKARRLDNLPAELALEMPQIIRQKGTLGCIWRWITIRSTTERDLEDVPEEEAKLLASSQIVVDSIKDATLIEVPAILLTEGHAHCREISIREFLNDAAPNRFTALPSAMFKRPDAGDMIDAYVDERRLRPWKLPGEENIVVLYDEPIDYVSFGAPTEPDADLSVKRIYDIQSKQGAIYQSYVIGHSLSKDGFFTYLIHIDKNSRDIVRLGPLAECEVPEGGRVEWYFPDSYASDVVLRLLTRLSAAKQLNGKLSFKRALQKVWKTLRVKRSSMSNPYYKLDIVPQSLFHDVSIRRGYIAKEKEAQEIAAPKKSRVVQPIGVSEPGRETLVRFSINHGHRAIVERFIATREAQEARVRAEALNADFDGGIKNINHLLRQARIIEIPWKFYWKQLELAFVNSHNRALLHWEEDEYLSRDWVSLTKNLRKLKGVDREMHDEIAVMTMREMQRTPWEPEMPFPVCWLGYDTPIGGTITMSHGGEQDYFSECYRLGANIDSARDGLPYLYGHLLTKTDVYAFFMLIRHSAQGDEPTNITFPLVERENGAWNHPAACSSLTLANIVRFIEEHQIVIEQSPSLRRTNDRIAKRISKAQRRKVEPPPYYTVYIKDGVYDVKKDPTREGTRGELTYSHDRAGGTYYKVRRGPLPLDKKTRADLERPRGQGWGYQIFEHEKPYGEWAEAIKKRGARPKGPDEWIAILKWRRRDTVVRPDLPKYIPSVRRSEKHKERRKDCA